jgi:hypothetical protein
MACIDWPYCMQGIVIGISDKDGFYGLRKDFEKHMASVPHTSIQSLIWSKKKKEEHAVRWTRWMTRKQKELLEKYGLNVGPIQRMVHIRILLGKYHGILVFVTC